MGMGALESKTFLPFLSRHEIAFSSLIRKKGLTITISGLSASGKSTIGEAIAKKYKLRYVTAGEIFRKYAKERKTPLEVFSKIRHRNIDYEMDRRSLILSIKGNVVIDARLSGWVAGEWADSRIYVHANQRNRAARMAKREKMSMSESIRVLRERDQEDSKKYEQLYKIDVMDRSIYDIVINNNNLTVSQLKKESLKRLKEHFEKNGIKVR